MIPVILRGDTPDAVALAPAPGYDYGGCTLEVEFNGARRAYSGLAAGRPVALALTAEETARMPLGTGRVHMRLRNAAGEVRGLPWAKVKVTDAPGEVRAARIAVDPAALDVADLTASDSLGAVKSRLNAVLAFLRGAAGCALAASLPCMGAVGPSTALDDVPGTATVGDLVRAGGAVTTNQVEPDAAHPGRAKTATAAEAASYANFATAAGSIDWGNVENRPDVATKTDLTKYLPLTGGDITGSLIVSGQLGGYILSATSELTIGQEDDAVTAASTGNGLVFGTWDRSSLIPSHLESTLTIDNSRVMTEKIVDGKLEGYATTNALAKTDASVAEAKDAADEAYSAAEQMVDAVNSLAGTIGTHIRDTSNPHKVTAAQVGALASTVTHLSGDVPTSRKVNGKALSADVTLAASDVGAVPTTRKVNGKALSADVTLGASDVGAYTKAEADAKVSAAVASRADAATVTNAVREVVRETGDLLWDEELQVTWKATFEGGYLWYTPVTNVNITGRGE